MYYRYTCHIGEAHIPIRNRNAKNENNCNTFRWKKLSFSLSIYTGSAWFAKCIEIISCLEDTMCPFCHRRAGSGSSESFVLTSYPLYRSRHLSVRAMHWSQPVSVVYCPLFIFPLHYHRQFLSSSSGFQSLIGGQHPASIVGIRHYALQSPYVAWFSTSFSSQ